MAEIDDPVATRALNRISVAPPYFDLGAMEQVGEGIVTAVVPPHPADDPEMGPVAAAQVARHLAILGSCAAALARDDEKRHHYLATRAHYSRMANAPTSVAQPLRAQAIASWVDRRTARAFITLTTAEGQGLNVLDVDYTVLTPKTFGRLNPPIEVDGSAADGPTATGDRFDVTDAEGGIRVDCGPVPVSMCAGHFPGYPAAPVAIVMGRLCRAAGIGLARHLGLDDHRHRIEEGHVAATGLARAGQRLELETRYDKPVRGGHELSGVALADGDVVGQLSVTLSIHSPAPVVGTENGDAGAVPDWPGPGGTELQRMGA